jgi:hypothetical protein
LASSSAFASLAAPPFLALPALLVLLRHGIARSELAMDREISWVAATWSATRCEHACFVWRRVSESGLATFSCDGCGRRRLCHAGGGNLQVSGLFSICGCGPSCRLFSGDYPRRCSHSCLDGVSGL